MGFSLSRLPYICAATAAIVYSAYYVLIWHYPRIRKMFGNKIVFPSSARQTCEPSGNKDSESPEANQGQLVSGEFYSTYHGHLIEHLAAVRSKIKSSSNASFVYLSGDSSLDNKHWFFDRRKSKRRQMHGETFTAPALNGYQDILVEPSRMVKDVCYHLNNFLQQKFGDGRVVCLNTAVEESTLADRLDHDPPLLLQDQFIRNHITEDDYLIVSVGGNDVALRPAVPTMISMGLLIKSPKWMIRYRLAPGFSYLVHLFHTRVQAYVRSLVAKRKPKKVLLCFIYYPDTTRGSWADQVLRLLGYDEDPGHLQLIIRTIFETIQSRGFDLGPGTEAIPVPLFEVLSTTEDYVQRVEPSVQGGRKMAAKFFSTLFPQPGL